MSVTNLRTSTVLVRIVVAAALTAALPDPSFFAHTHARDAPGHVHAHGVGSHARGHDHGHDHGHRHEAGSPAHGHDHHREAAVLRHRQASATREAGGAETEPVAEGEASTWIAAESGAAHWHVGRPLQPTGAPGVLVPASAVRVQLLAALPAARHPSVARPVRRARGPPNSPTAC